MFINRNIQIYTQVFWKTIVSGNHILTTDFQNHCCVAKMYRTRLGPVQLQLNFNIYALSNIYCINNGVRWIFVRHLASVLFFSLISDYCPRSERSVPLNKYVHTFSSGRQEEWGRMALELSCTWHTSSNKCKITKKRTV